MTARRNRSGAASWIARSVSGRGIMVRPPRPVVAGGNSCVCASPTASPLVLRMPRATVRRYQKTRMVEATTVSRIALAKYIPSIPGTWFVIVRSPILRTGLLEVLIETRQNAIRFLLGVGHGQVVRPVLRHRKP